MQLAVCSAEEAAQCSSPFVVQCSVWKVLTRSGAQGSPPEEEMVTAHQKRRSCEEEIEQDTRAAEQDGVS